MWADNQSETKIVMYAFAGGNSLDRASVVREDPEALDALLASERCRILPFCDGKPLIAKGRWLGWVNGNDICISLSSSEAVFIGFYGSDPCFAIQTEGQISSWESGGVWIHQLNSDGDLVAQAEVNFMGLRGVMASLHPDEAELAATGKSLLGWHHTHGFCGACGQPSKPSMGGWQRICPKCRTLHFPRTDPVVIMLIEGPNCVLLGRSHQWPDRMYSILAGFIEPGETIEAAVRREVLEETGVSVKNIRYVASQPWPFPSSLMIGCRGSAISTELHINNNELEDACWVTREELLCVFSNTHSDIRAPRKGSIAEYLLYGWLAAKLPDE